MKLKRCFFDWKTVKGDRVNVQQMAPEDSIILCDGSDKMVSIIIPVYNAEKTIERCVASVLRQQYPQKEIILINDGSKDGSLEILRRLEEQHDEITVVDKPNGGVSSARNAGLEICTGNYVTFIDSDDYYLSDDYVANMAALLDENESIDLVISGFTLLSGTQRTAYAATSHTKDIAALALDFWQYVRMDVTNSPWNKMYRRNLISCMFPTEMTMGEDAVFVLRYLQNCRAVVFDDNCGYGYVYELSSTTAQFRKKVAYDMRQSGIYYDAIHSFWDRFLPVDLTARNYTQMKTDEVYTMMRSLLLKKGLAAYLKWDITDVITDERFRRYYPMAKDRFARHPHKNLMKAIASSAQLRVKMCCLYYWIKGIIAARMRK